MNSSNASERIAPSFTHSLDANARTSNTVSNFGKRWTAIFVYERRQFFTPLYCRQLVWAIVEEGRAYFATRMSPDDFINVSPYDIIYPRSSLIDLLAYVRHQTPII